MANHIVEMPIYTEPWEESAIEKRFQAAKEVYNAVLGEYLKRVDLARDSIAFKSGQPLGGFQRVRRQIHPEDAR